MKPRDDLDFIFDTLTCYPFVLELRPSSEAYTDRVARFLKLVKLLDDGGHLLDATSIAPEHGWDYDVVNISDGLRSLSGFFIQIGFDDELDYHRFLFGIHEVMKQDIQYS